MDFSRHSICTLRLCAFIFFSTSAAVNADDLAKQSEILQTVDQVVAAGPYRPDFAALSSYQVPDWYRDAKFGIFLHWGVFSVPAWDTEWYPHYMYVVGSDEYSHHLATYGPLSSFGYKDFIPMFTGSQFDPDAWAELFKSAGAKFIVPVAEHADGFSMWNNPLNAYNSLNMGPHVDSTGALATAVRKRGLAFGLSNHRIYLWSYFNPGMGDPGSDVQNPAYADLYGPAMPTTTAPNDGFLSNWLAHAAASVDAYQPDLLYLDNGLGDPGDVPYLQNLGAHLYNRAAMWNKDVVMTEKDGYPGHTATFDVELGTEAQISPDAWQEDTSVVVGSWGYTTNAIYKDPGWLITELIDDASKNGNLLLNVGPESDGTIPPEAQQILHQMGHWLSVNGESIYGTRPWNVYGEGTNVFTVAAYSDNSHPPAFAGSDIRFTRKGNILYAALLAWPGPQATITSLSSTSPAPVSGVISSVQLLGYDGQLTWSQTPAGLMVNMPSSPPETGYAYVLKITGLKLSGIPPNGNGTLRLSCSQATLNQSSIQRLQFGLTASCYFDEAGETATWTAALASPGTYAVTVTGSAAEGAPTFQLTGCNGQTLSFLMNQTAGWEQFETINAGYLSAAAAGDCDITVQASGAMNIAHIDLRPVIMGLHLTADAATLNGPDLSLFTQDGISFIGYWINGLGSISWLAHFPAAGTYAVTGLYANGAVDSSATIDIGGQPALGSLTLSAKNTNGWNNFVTFGAGNVIIPAAGDYTVSVRATDIPTWQPINVAYLDFAQQPAAASGSH